MTVTAAKTSLLNGLAFFSNFVAFIPTSFKWQMKAIFHGVELLRIAHKIKKGRKSRSVFTSFINRPVRQFHLLGMKRLQRSEMYQKSDLHYCCFVHLKTYWFFEVLVAAAVAGADPGVFLGGGALASCATSTPINHIVFFFCRIPVVLENRRSSQGGGVRTPCTLPLDPPLCSRCRSSLLILWLISHRPQTQ